MAKSLPRGSGPGTDDSLTVNTYPSKNVGRASAAWKARGNMRNDDVLTMVRGLTKNPRRFGKDTVLRKRDAAAPSKRGR